jgi:glycosyltransferase involved in cell wall biosynthesis
VQCNDFYNLLGAGIKLFGYKGALITYVRFMPSAIPGLLRKLWINLAQKYSHRVIAVSNSVLKQLPVKANTIRLYDAANLIERIDNNKATSDGTIELLYLSNYIPGKGQDYALEAFIRAYTINNTLRLKFTGGDMGLTKNKEFKQSLEQKTKQHSLTNVVMFDDFNDNIEAIIKSADILLNFSNSESLSMTCLESSYFGTPVIATRCGGPEEVIINNETGILVPIADIDAMANAIIELSADKTKRTAYAEAGKIYVRDKFSKEKFVQQFNDILKQ